MTSFEDFVRLNKSTNNLIGIAIELKKIGGRVPEGLKVLIDKQASQQDKILQEWREK